MKVLWRVFFLFLVSINYVSAVEVGNYSANIDNRIGTLVVTRPPFVLSTFPFLRGQFQGAEEGSGIRTGRPYHYFARTILRRQAKEQRRLITYFQNIYPGRALKFRLLGSALRGESTQLIAHHLYNDRPHDRLLLPGHIYSSEPAPHLDAWVFLYEVQIVGQRPFMVEVGYLETDFLSVHVRGIDCAVVLKRILDPQESPIVYVQ